jgi:hypothetical protein
MHPHNPNRACKRDLIFTVERSSKQEKQSIKLVENLENSLIRKNHKLKAGDTKIAGKDSLIRLLFTTTRLLYKELVK